jgi:type VI secretion system protein ImpF
MADLTLNDRLQPALLDRLLDDERTVALIRIVIEAAALQRLKLPVPALLDILRGQGLTLQRQEPAGDFIELRFTASRSHASPANLRALVIRPPGAPDGVSLQSFATLESAAIPNVELEPAERRLLSKAKLRECVHRDLGWLFNSLSLDSSQDLAAFPQVATSVLNFGLPSFAGRMTSSIDPVAAAEQLREAIERYEPRLRAVRVRSRELGEDEERHGDSDGTLEFVIEAELWGQPTSQHLELHTTIDTMSGDISVSEPRG